MYQCIPRALKTRDNLNVCRRKETIKVNIERSVIKLVENPEAKCWCLESVKKKKAEKLT